MTSGLATCAMAAVQACTSETVSGVDIGSVQVSPPASSIMKGFSVQFGAVVYDETGVALAPAVVTWSSDDESVATVDAQGVATGVATGETTIRATFNGTEDGAHLTVQPAPGVAVTPSSATIYGGASGPAPGPATLFLTPVGSGSVGALTVAVSYPAGSPSGWLSAALSAATLPSDLTLRAVPDGLQAGRHRATVEVAWSSTEAGDGAASVPVTLSLTAFTVTESDGATRVSESGTIDSLTVALDVAPTSEVTLVVSSADPSQATVSPATLTFTPANGFAPQIVTVTAIDDVDVDGDRTTGVTLSVDDSRSDVAYRPAVDRSVSVTTLDDERAGVMVSDTAGTVVSEAGGADSLRVVLKARPPSDVVIVVTASDGGEATAVPSTFTFGSVDWDVPRVVTVTGVDDALVDGSQTSTVTLRVDEGRSDATYGGLPEAVVAVTTLDDDSAGLSITQSQLVVTEAGGTSAFTVALAAEPSSTVVLAVSSADIGEATASPATLTFPSASWSAPQTVTLRGVDDAVADGDRKTAVTVSVVDGQSDAAFSGVSATAEVTTTDDDVAGVAVSETALTVLEVGGAAVFSVRLGSEPTADVVIDVTSLDLGEVLALPTSLTFDAATWSVPQVVSVLGVADAIVDGDQATRIVIAVDPSGSDPTYVALPTREVLVTTTDVDLGLPAAGGR